MSKDQSLSQRLKSLPPRGAWIEITEEKMAQSAAVKVAPPTGSVD